MLTSIATIKKPLMQTPAIALPKIPSPPHFFVRTSAMTPRINPLTISRMVVPPTIIMATRLLRTSSRLHPLTAIATKGAARLNLAACLAKYHPSEDSTLTGIGGGCFLFAVQRERSAPHSAHVFIVSPCSPGISHSHIGQLIIVILFAELSLAAPVSVMILPSFFSYFCPHLFAFVFRFLFVLH